MSFERLKLLGDDIHKHLSFDHVMTNTALVFSEQPKPNAAVRLCYLIVLCPRDKKPDSMLHFQAMCNQKNTPRRSWQMINVAAAEGQSRLDDKALSIGLRMSCIKVLQP
jgi:hypothetical protein